MDPLVAAIDQGTSSTRFLVSDVVRLINLLLIVSDCMNKTCFFTFHSVLRENEAGKFRHPRLKLKLVARGNVKFV